MENYYDILGVEESASVDEIKKVYRKLAMKHHPDRGGDQELFKRINTAYDTLSDNNKRAQYDAMRQGGPQIRFTSGNFNFDEIFSHFGGVNPFGDIFNQARRAPRNRDLNIHCKISLLDSYQGKELEAKFNLPSGKPQTAHITIPQGIRHGETIRYNGLGDDSIENIPRGNLNVTILIEPDSVFARRDDDLFMEIEINPLEAIIGCKRDITLISGEVVELKIRSGVETGVEFSQSGRGFKNPQTGKVGKFVGMIRIKPPLNLDKEILDQIKELNKKITLKT